MVIDLHPEFGLELALGITYAHWLHERGELEGVRTVKGMKPFYYFCDNVEEIHDHRTIDNAAAGLNTLPNNWIHHNATQIFGKDYNDLTDQEQAKANGYLDYSQWICPSYKQYYKKQVRELILDRDGYIGANTFLKSEIKGLEKELKDLEIAYDKLLNEHIFGTPTDGLEVGSPKDYEDNIQLELFND